MAEPWPLAQQSNDVVEAYYAWAAKNYTLFNDSKMLCNWFPLQVLIEFAAVQGVSVRLDYWPGQAPVNGKRFWDTRTRKLLDSHGGMFGSKRDFLIRARSTVTARMIGSMNSVAIDAAGARAGDLICRNYSNTYWHVELITGNSGGVISAQSGNVPAIAPREHPGSYRRLDTAGGSVYQGRPRRWEFEEIFAPA